MNRFAAIAAAMIPAFCLQQPAAAQITPSLHDKLNAADKIIKRWEHRAKGIEQDLKRFGVKLPQTATLPKAPTAPTDGNTAVSCESALFFDADNSALVYVGNVFLQDARLNLFARNRLYFRMETGLKGNDKPKQQAKSAAKNDTPAPAAPVPAAEQPEVIEAKPALDFSGANIETHDAVVNVLDNFIILSSPDGGMPIHLKYGENEVWIRPGAKRPGRFLADAEGNIMLSGADVSLKWVDEQGQANTLQTHAGMMFYNAEDGTLTLPNGGTFTHPDGRISCTQELSVRLKKSATPQPAKKGFMQQFAGMKFEGINSASACGNVSAETTGTQGSKPAKLTGEKLVYNGATGACSLYGASCEVVYDKNRIYSNESILLHPNGDLELNGSDICGQYERAASNEAGNMLAGTFKANSNIIFHAATGTITTAKGIQAKDAETDFSCSGPVEIQLAKGAHAGTSKAPAPGMPNLAIAEYRELLTLSAEGNIIAHQYDPQTGTQIGKLRAETLRTNLRTGETHLQGTTQIPAIVEHQGNTLEARPGKTIPTLHLAANGDINMKGDTINANFTTKDGKTTASCKNYIRLVRATNKLETGSSTVMNSPQGIFTTNAPLVVSLTPEEGAKPGTGKLAHLRFNYADIKEAYTAAGGTMRTVQGSMQCSGPIRITLDEANKAKDKELAGIRKATAAGNVALAGKDNKGRILKAMGDYLSVDAVSGIKRLTGSRVILSDQYNTHIASGKNAAITIDSKNNARITGKKHTTIATKIHEQMNKEKSKQQ